MRPFNLDRLGDPERRIVSLSAYKQARDLMAQDANSAARIAAIMREAQRDRAQEGHWREVQMWVARLRRRRV